MAHTVRTCVDICSKPQGRQLQGTLGSPQYQVPAWHHLAPCTWPSPRGHKMAATAPAVTVSHTTSGKNREQVSKRSTFFMHFSYFQKPRTPRLRNASLTRRTGHAHPVLMPGKADYTACGCHRNTVIRVWGQARYLPNKSLRSGGQKKMGCYS